MLAGAKYRGEFEERLKSLIDEVRQNGNTILFLDEVHTVIGAGASEGSVDASNILKPRDFGENNQAEQWRTVANA